MTDYTLTGPRSPGLTPRYALLFNRGCTRRAALPFRKGLSKRTIYFGLSFGAAMPHGRRPDGEHNKI